MKIKNHEIISEINRGSLTTVYKAKHLNLDRPVLLKVLNKQWLNEKDLLARFKREAQISARLNHPNIVNVYDFEISPELVYISLEFIEGISLDQYIKENHPVSLEKAENIVLNILNALDYAHKNKVIHRDIKPGNILLDEKLNARLTDFGLAALQDLPGLTEQGQSMGTPAYMAPELVSGEKPGIQSDIYSLGITFYELICGESPFKKENTAATLQSILNDTLPDLKAKRPDAPGWLAELVHKMCRKTVQERPANIAEIFKTIPNYSPEKSVSQREIKKAKLPLYISVIVFIVLSGLIAIYFQNEHKNQLIVKADSLKEPATPVELKLDSIIQDSSVKEKQIISNTKQKEPIIGQSEAKLKDTINIAEEKMMDVSAEETYGEVFIHCIPWANIYIDDDSIGQTPLNKSLKLKSGTYILELRNPNYLSQKKELLVSAGQSDTINIQLLPAYGYLDVDVRPWAKIYLNDEYKDDTPLKKPIVVQAGTNIIKMINPQYGTIIDTLYIEPGKTLRKIFTYKN